MPVVRRRADAGWDGNEPAVGEIHGVQEVPARLGQRRLPVEADPDLDAVEYAVLGVEIRGEQRAVATVGDDAFGWAAESGCMCTPSSARAVVSARCPARLFRARTSRPTDSGRSANARRSGSSSMSGWVRTPARLKVAKSSSEGTVALSDHK